jgi:hypothetical protein
MARARNMELCALRAQATLAGAVAFCRLLAALEAAGKKGTFKNLPSGVRQEEERQIARRKGWAIFPAKQPGNQGGNRGWILTDAGRAMLALPAAQASPQQAAE